MLANGAQLGAVLMGVIGAMVVAYLVRRPMSRSATFSAGVAVTGALVMLAGVLLSILLNGGLG